MKFIDPYIERVPQAPGVAGAWAMAAYAARICYLSEKINTNESEEQFCRRVLLKHKDNEKNHLTPLEHGTVYLYLEVNPHNAFKSCPEYNDWFTARFNWSDVVGRISANYRGNKYSKVLTINDDSTKRVYITTNLRVLTENGWLDDLRYWSEPTIHLRRISVKTVCSRAVSMEFLRHDFSFCQESQRYCNYSKDKFGNEITYIKPIWAEDSSSPKTDVLIAALTEDETKYFKLLELGASPEEAREVLPNSTKTTLLMTGFTNTWEHFFALRVFGVSGKPHPEAERLAQLICNEIDICRL